MSLVVESLPASVPATIRGGFISYPAWSPDGERLAYAVVSGEPGRPQYEIWVMLADGSNPKRLLDGKDELAIDGRSLAWSPDGARLAFAARSLSGGLYASQIFLVWSDGSGLIAVTAPQLESFAPNWAPDSQALVFTAQDGQVADLYTVEIGDAFSAAEGLTARRLTATGQEQNPRWQP